MIAGDEELNTMDKSLNKVKLTPPKTSFCIAMLLFFIFIASLMTYFCIDLFDGYAKVKVTIENGQLVECKFKEVGRQLYAKGYTYGDGYDYYAIYEYVDENGNRYKAESTREFKSTEAVIDYVESHPTKSIYIDGNGFSVSGDETVTNHAVTQIIIVVVTVFLYVAVIGFAIQLTRRISINRSKDAANRELYRENQKEKNP